MINLFKRKVKLINLLNKKENVIDTSLEYDKFHKKCVQTILNILQKIEQPERTRVIYFYLTVFLYNNFVKLAEKLIAEMKDFKDHNVQNITRDKAFTIISSYWADYGNFENALSKLENIKDSSLKNIKIKELEQLKSNAKEKKVLKPSNQKISTEQPQLLFDVFKEIFSNIGRNHYELMMEEEFES